MEEYHKDRIIIRMSGIFLLNFLIPFFSKDKTGSLEYWCFSSTLK